MSFTEKVRGTYGFLEQTLNDLTMVVTNATTRKMLQNEIVLVSGIFGNVLEHNGIAGSASGKINISANRTIKTNQLATGAGFEVGDTVYAVDATNDAPVGLTNSSTGNTPIGICVEVDPATTQLYVVFRPFIQPVNITAVEADVTQLKADVDALEANDVKVAVLSVDKDASAGLAFANTATGLAVGDKIVDIIVRADAANAAGTAKVTHGGAEGADITDAISNVADGTIGRAGKVVDGVITADGLVITTDDATTKCTVYVTYIPA